MLCDDVRDVVCAGCSPAGMVGGAMSAAASDAASAARERQQRDRDAAADLSRAGDARDHGVEGDRQDPARSPSAVMVRGAAPTKAITATSTEERGGERGERGRLDVDDDVSARSGASRLAWRPWPYATGACRTRRRIPAATRLGPVGPFDRLDRADDRRRRRADRR